MKTTHPFIIGIDTHKASHVAVPQDDDSLLEVLGESLKLGEISDTAIAKNEQERNDIWHSIGSFQDAF